MKTRFIVNPRSGRAAAALTEVRRFVEQNASALVITERPRHAAELAKQSVEEGYELVVAVGGDGTMNEIAGVLTGTSATLGLIPCGSGDGLGRHLGIHGSVSRALNILRTGRPRLIDAGLADGHPFFTVAGLGFEAHIADRFNRLQSRGFLRYLTTSAAALREWQSEDYAVTDGGRTETWRAFTLAVANAQQYGNNARIAPNARIADGLLDLCVVPPVGFLNALPLVSRLFGGSLGNARGVVSRRAARFIVQRSAPGLIHTDGEVHSAGCVVEFSVRPASLRVMVPAASADA